MVFPFHCFHQLTKSRRIQTLAGARFESRGIFSTIFQQPTCRNFHVRLTDGFDFPLTLLQPLGIRVYESCIDPCKDVQPVDQPRQAKCTSSIAFRLGKVCEGILKIGSFQVCLKASLNSFDILKLQSELIRYYIFLDIYRRAKSPEKR